MIIQLRGVQDDEVREICHEYDAKDLDIEFDDLVYAGPIVFRGTFEKGKETLTLNGELSAEIQQKCGKCLEVDTNKLSKFVTFYFDVKDLIEIDATEEIRETLVIDHPMVYVCKKGQNQDCSLKHEESFDESPKKNPFSSLKDLLDRDKKEF